MAAPTHIAVLGGGLSGLSSAFHLSRRHPAAHITLLERSSRLGGWVRSERVNVRDGNGNQARVLLERGPRTLRPNGRAVLELINLLDLSPSLLTVPKTAPAARTRFLHIPGTHGLTTLPSSFGSLFTSSLGRVMLLAGMSEPFRRHPLFGTRDIANTDQPLEQFLAARLGPELARTLGSALVHGIYAADSRMLSVRAAFPSLWELARDGWGSIARGVAVRQMRHLSGRLEPKEEASYDIGRVSDLMRGVSVYSFKEGMTTIVHALEDNLMRRSNVAIRKNEGIASLSKDSGSFTVHTTAGNTLPVSHIVFAMPLSVLEAILERSPVPPLPNLRANPSSSVTVVNLIFPPTPTGQPIHCEGFGYLIPRDKNGHVEVLGTVFDSCALGAQDEYASAESPRFTKMTMMVRLQPSSLPITQERILQHLTTHLAPPTPLPEPVYFKAHDLRDCIPAPSVGHVKRMKELAEVLRKEWDGKLAVVGAGVGGVSVGDCIEQGRRVGEGW